MIITCEKCNTRFHLEDGKVPAQGARVRCSRCKHAFLVRPPDASDEETVERLASEPVRGRAASKATRPADDPPPEPALGSGDFDEESDWEFNEDPGVPDEAPHGPSVLASAAAVESMSGRSSVQPAAPEQAGRDLRGEDEASEPSALKDLGSPEEWEVGDEEASLAPGDEEASAPSLPETAPVDLPEPDRARSSAAEVEGDELLERSGSALPARAFRAAGWLAAALLFLVAAQGSLLPRWGAARDRVWATEVAGLRLEEVRGRILENASAGRLFVVSGRLRNPDTQPRAPGRILEVRLLGEDGRPLPGARAPLGPALPPARLREEPPARLAAAQEEAARRLAATELAPGEAIRFAAVFEVLPGEALAFRFEDVTTSARTGASPPRSRPFSE